MVRTDFRECAVKGKCELKAEGLHLLIKNVNGQKLNKGKAGKREFEDCVDMRWY